MLTLSPASVRHAAATISAITITTIIIIVVIHNLIAIITMATTSTIISSQRLTGQFFCVFLCIIVAYLLCVNGSKHVQM